ncbi:RHS repeat-associated core domain-containing protein [Anoxybacillus rupiensis]|uniref:RHS repeat-associated core domain-containing protein n=1 Tax=Anoxybacteroides rupiense TaxID=311460 RepID=A0ABD5IY76_9BACL|nr:RHS repeat-associated core domain-containing protein [Anoxybacillus rupiensis]
MNGVTYHYHYDGSDLIRVTNDNRQTVWAFTWANGKPNTVTNQNGNTFYYVTNYRGDVVRIIDENGATVANYSYDPWGKVLSVSENAAVTGQPLGYAGYYYDRETKLYYLQARYYDPETARFLSRDPYPGDLDNPITQNGYTYANNNPVIYVDPDGNNPVFAALVGTILRFATPLIRKYGAKAIQYVGTKIRNFALKLFKNLTDRYRITSSSSAVVVILDKKNGNKRVFSLDYHDKIPLRKIGQKGKVKNIKVWHYHMNDPKVHYVFRWSIPSGYTLYEENYSYRLVW